MSSTGWTNNAALCVAKWFTSDFGMNLPWADLDEESVIAAANACDERVLTQGSTTFSPEVGSPTTNAMTLAAGARALDVADGVRVSSSGSLPGGLAAATTYYVIPFDRGTIKLASTVANAFAGTAVPLGTGGSGTLTLSYYDEARYKLNGAYTLDSSKGDVLQQLLSAMAGVAVYIGGKWFIHAGVAAAPVVTLTEDDLRADMAWTPKRSMRDRFNGVRAVYVNPTANWQPVDAPPLQNATYLAEDDGEELYEDVRLPFTTSTPTVQRLMKIALERNRQQGILQFPAKLTAMRLQVWDGVYVRNERYGWDQKQFRVIGWALAEDGGIDLTLQEDSANVYSWTAAEESAAALQQGVVLPDPSTIAAPATVTVTVIETGTYTRVEASWSETASIWLDGYDVEFKDAAASDWTSYGRVGADSARVAVFERGAATDVRVRAVTKNGSTSDFTTNTSPGIPTGASATGGVGQISLAWTNGAGADRVQIFVNTTSDFSSATLLTTTGGGSPQAAAYVHSGLGAAVTRYYWLRSVNAAGNVSNTTTAVNATTNP